MEYLNSFSGFAGKGGIFIYPIIACSVFGLAIFLQKMWYLRSSKVIPRAFLNRFYALLNENRFEEARSICRESDSSIARIGDTALEYAFADSAQIEDRIEETGQKETLELGRYIEALGAVSNVSTLLGLLGTIAGMIKIFNVISTQDIVNPPALAGGISEALYTTAFGLTVAIPAFIAYKYTSGRYEELITLMEQEANRITVFLKSVNTETSGGNIAEETEV